MSLLTPEQILQIRSEIGKVTDTFFVTPVTYELVGDSFDRRGEDRADRVNETFELMALVEYPNGSVKEETGGAIDRASVMVTFSMDNLYEVGREPVPDPLPDPPPAVVNPIVDGTHYQVRFRAANDFMVINGKRYETKYVKYDGPLEQKNVLVVVYADLEEAPV